MSIRVTKHNQHSIHRKWHPHGVHVICGDVVHEQAYVMYHNKDHRQVVLMTGDIVTSHVSKSVRESYASAYRQARTIARNLANRSE